MYQHSRVLATTLTKCFRTSVRPLSLSSTRMEEHFSDTDGRTIMTSLNKESDGTIMINAFSESGFRLNNGLKVIGPMALFHRSILSWQVKTCEDINEDSLSLFYMLEPKIDVLVIGVGDKGNMIDIKLISFLRNKGISVEILPTQTACSTFNYLTSEYRSVAAALIPPSSISFSQAELVESVRKSRMAFLDEDEPIFDITEEHPQTLKEPRKNLSDDKQ